MITKNENYNDSSLDALLDLMVKSFQWIMVIGLNLRFFELKKAKHIPHGIKYSLTLHDKYNKRIIGFDNAHAFKTKKVFFFILFIFFRVIQVQK